MDPDKLEVGRLIHMLKQISADADVSQLLSTLLNVPMKTVNASQVLAECEGQEPTSIVSANRECDGLVFTPKLIVS